MLMGAGGGAGKAATVTGGATAAPGIMPSAPLSTFAVGAAGKALAISGGVSDGGGAPLLISARLR